MNLPRLPVPLFLILALCLSACGSAPPRAAAAAAHEVIGAAAPASAWQVEAIEWQVPASAALSPQEQAQLCAQLRAALQAALAGKADPRHALTVRARITAIEPVSPGLNTLSALLLFVPLDAGAATVHIEAFDRDTGARVASLDQRYAPPMRQLRARFKRLGPAELALQQLAQAFALQVVAAQAASATAAR